VDGHWLFRRRRIKSWYRQEFGHPAHGSERVVTAPATSGPQRGAPMPDAFPTFDAFWSRPSIA
jgi:hypothetical protein